MNSYETVILVTNTINDEQRKDVLEKIKKLISVNGTITSTEELGEKKLKKYGIDNYKLYMEEESKTDLYTRFSKVKGEQNK